MHRTTLAVLLALALLPACRRHRNSDDAVEIARLRSEQAELKARIAALEAKLTAPPPTVDAPRPPAEPVTPTPTPTPTTAVPAPAPSVAARPTALAVEDLQGRPATAHPTSALGLDSAGAGAVSDKQSAELLDQLHKQLDTIRSKQAEQEKILDELDKLR